MLQIARDCVGRESPNCFSLGNYCTFAGDLQKCREQESSSPHKVLLNGVTEKKLSVPSDTAMSVSDECGVFLGGSCNPTTWRKDIAIPIFKRYGISFYNPQVAHWDKSLIELERNAKQKANVLFFVFDRSTRNIASMVEAAYLSGSCRKLVIVLDNYVGAGQLINGEAISQREYEELSGSLRTLQDLADRHSIPIFTHIKRAVLWTANSLRDNSWSMKFDPRESYQTRRSQCQLTEKLMKSNNISSSSKPSRITLDEACMVFKAVVGRDLTKIELQTIEAAKNNGLSSMEVRRMGVLISFDEFCCIISEFDSRRFERKKILQLLSYSVLSSIQKYVDWALPNGPHSTKSSTAKDVYLGGSLSASSWRENTVIPFLRKHGLTYHTPNSNSADASESRFSASEAAILEECRTVLFVIDNTSRNVSQTAIANYCIALGLPVVLCVKMLSQDTTLNGEQLSTYAIKDYNRGRSYLIDQAKEKGVPVFQELSESLEYLVQKCKTPR